MGLREERLVVDLRAFALTWSKKIGIPKEEAEKHLSVLSGVMFECLARGEEIRIPHLGKLVPKLVPSHKGFNYITKKGSVVPTYISVKFKQYQSAKHSLWRTSPLNCKANLDLETELPFEDS